MTEGPAMRLAAVRAEADRRKARIEAEAKRRQARQERCQEAVRDLARALEPLSEMEVYRDDGSRLTVKVQRARGEAKLALVVWGGGEPRILWRFEAEADDLRAWLVHDGEEVSLDVAVDMCASACADLFKAPPTAPAARLEPGEVPF